jgi:hypothetical protein
MLKVYTIYGILISSYFPVQRGEDRSIITVKIFL